MLKFKKQLILASQSPRRKILLSQIVSQKFKIVKSGIEEIMDTKISFQKNVQKIAEQKAINVSQKFKNAIVIAADTIVCLNGTYFGKPKDENDAFKMLKQLSGKTHIVFTGYSIIDTKTKKNVTNFCSTKVKFKKLLQNEIVSYIKTSFPLDKAGSYGIQDDFGAVFVEKINGDFYNVVGLPICKLYNDLKKFL